MSRSTSLAQLAREAPFARPLGVPDWTLGCWKRRCITYADGREDTATTVIWIQSHGLTGDLRIPRWRPSAVGGKDFAGFGPDELALLASVEGGVADTAWAGDRMAWSNWSAFQPYDKWPEPGVLQRVGASLIEWAPSGIYVEDWRLQAGSSGLMAGLRLQAEVRDGVQRRRDGGLVICGDHALFSLGRFEELPAKLPAQRQLACGVERVFEAEASYCVRDGDGFGVELSTNPFRHGEPAPFNGGFEAMAPGLLRQTVGDVVRLWSVDTLLPQVEVSPATPASQAGLAWLDGEADVLLRE
jgi:hypothetical protein